MMSVRIRTAAAAIATVLACAAFSQVKPDSPVKTVRFSGTISEYAGPLGNQVLRLKAEGLDFTATTDAQGHFLFPALAPNRTYQLLVGDSPKVIMGIEVKGVDLELHIGTDLNRPVGVWGRAVDYNGAAAQNQTVTLSGTASQEWTTQTDQYGAFKFPSVPENQHYGLRIAGPELSPVMLDVIAEDRNIDLGTVVLQPTTPFVSLAPPVAAPQAPVQVKGVRIYGRITNADGVPMADRVLWFGNQANGSAFLRTDRNGVFVFPALRQNDYAISLLPDQQIPLPMGKAVKVLATIETSDGLDISLGNIALVPPGSKADLTGDLLGPVAVTPLVPRPVKPPAKLAAVGALFVGTRGATVIHDDGKVVPQAKEEEQVGCSSPRIADDRSAVGWLVDSDFCCTSYPIQRMLVVYRPGKPVLRFTGDGRPIFEWQFVNGAKQVSFYQDFLHGTPRQHYELRDLETGRLVAKWDGELTPRAPAWTQGLK